MTIQCCCLHKWTLHTYASQSVSTKSWAAGAHRSLKTIHKACSIASTVRKSTWASIQYRSLNWKQTPARNWSEIFPVTFRHYMHQYSRIELTVGLWEHWNQWQKTVECYGRKALHSLPRWWTTNSIGNLRVYTIWYSPLTPCALSQTRIAADSSHTIQ